MQRVECRRFEAVIVEEVPWGVRRQLFLWGNGKRTVTKAYMLFLARWARRLSWKESAAFHASLEKAFDAVEHVATFGLNTAHSGLSTLSGSPRSTMAKGPST
jgi:transposase